LFINKFGFKDCHIPKCGSLKRLFNNFLNDYLLAILGESADKCFIDDSNRKTCFANFGRDSWIYGNELCQSLGGQLPMIETSGKEIFLENNFGSFWIGLTTSGRFVHSTYLSFWHER